MELDSSGLRCGLLVSSCEDSDEPLCSRKCGISWIAEQLLASEVEVCAIELVAVSVYCHWQDDWITEWWKVVEGSTVAWSAYSLDICLEEWNEFVKNVMMVCVCVCFAHACCYIILLGIPPETKPTRRRKNQRMTQVKMFIHF